MLVAPSFEKQLTLIEELQRSLPARALSRVVLPEPGGPRRSVNVPCMCHQNLSYCAEEFTLCKSSCANTMSYRISWIAHYVQPSSASHAISDGPSALGQVMLGCLRQP